MTCPDRGLFVGNETGLSAVSSWQRTPCWLLPVSVPLRVPRALTRIFPVRSERAELRSPWALPGEVGGQAGQGVRALAVVLHRARHDLSSWTGTWRGEGDGFASEAEEPGPGPGGLTPEAMPGVPSWTE